MEVLDNLSDELGDIQHELKIQFTRIAEIQADLDMLRDRLKTSS